MAGNDEDIKWERDNQKKSSKNPRKELERKRLLKKKAKRKARIRVVVGTIIIALGLLVAFVGINLFSFITNLKSDDIMAGNAPKGNSSLNILIVGMDIGDVEYTDNDSARRTDTLMVYNYNTITKNSKIISIPRDTLIEVENAYEDGVYMPYWKINSAYALGGEEELVMHVEELLDLDINYIFEVNYSAFRNFIDAIGGVEMYIEQDMYYDDDEQDLHINFKGGETVLLDGRGAEEFFRWRQNNDGSGLEDGDLGRIKNQQKFITKVIEKCMTPSVIMRMPTILNTIEEDITTNMSGSTLISTGLKFLGSESRTMHTLQGDSEYLYGKSFLVVEEEDNLELINSLKSGNNLENPIDKSMYNIKILNGTRVDGLAGNLKAELENLGYTNIDVGNSEKIEDSIILGNDKELNDQLRSETGINRNDKDKEANYEGYDAVIIIGEDYLVFGE